MGTSLAVKMDRVAESIAAKFGETGHRQIAQIHRMVATAGPTWCLLAASIAETAIADGDGLWTISKDGGRRTPGGVFFAVARSRASSLVAEGKLSRRQFFRTFTDYPPQPRAPKPPPPKKERTPRPNPGAAAKRVHDRRAREVVAPEVYVRRAVR